VWKKESKTFTHTLCLCGWVGGLHLLVASKEEAAESVKTHGGDRGRHRQRGLRERLARTKVEHEQRRETPTRLQAHPQRRIGTQAHTHAQRERERADAGTHMQGVRVHQHKPTQAMVCMREPRGVRGWWVVWVHTTTRLLLVG
jgi:hypothetical protein